jgi:hypothetical protein
MAEAIAESIAVLISVVTDWEGRLLKYLIIVLLYNAIQEAPPSIFVF